MAPSLLQNPQTSLSPEDSPSDSDAPRSPKPSIKSNPQISHSESTNPPCSSDESWAKDASIEVQSKKNTRKYWSKREVLAVLGAMVDYRSKFEADPYCDPTAFHEFVKESISGDVSKAQLFAKILTMKMKYEADLCVEKNGEEEEPMFSNSHEKEVFELSKKIWGAGCEFHKTLCNNSVCSSCGKRKRDESEENRYEFPPGFVEFVTENMRMNPIEVKKGLHLAAKSDVKKLITRWRKMKRREAQVYLERLELIREHAKLALKAIKSRLK